MNAISSELTHRVGSALMLPLALLMMTTGHRTDKTRTPVQASELRGLDQAKARLAALREERVDNAMIGTAEALVARLDDQVAGATSRPRSPSRH